jgi:hypothetical protein
MGVKQAVNIYDTKMEKKERRLNNSLITDYRSERPPEFA